MLKIVIPCLKIYVISLKVLESRCQMVKLVHELVIHQARLCSWDAEFAAAHKGFVSGMKTGAMYQAGWVMFKHEDWLNSASQVAGGCLGVRYTQIGSSVQLAKRACWAMPRISAKIVVLIVHDQESSPKAFSAVYRCCSMCVWSR